MKEAMNNIYNISKDIMCKASRMGRMLSVWFLLALSSNAWATYYLKMCTDNNSWNYSYTSEDGYFEWSDAALLVAETDIYVRVLTSNSGSWKNTQAYCDGVSGGVAGLYQVSTVENKPENNCVEMYAKYRLNVNVQSVKLQYIHTNTHNTCGGTVDKGTYNFEFAVPTYKLCGSFTDWDPEYGLEMTEVGTTGVFTAQVYLPADKNYRKQTAEGFKIAGVSGGSATWFGADATITKDNKAIKVTSTDGGSDNGNRCGITTDYSGYYTFAYKPSETTNNNLTVTYPTAVSSTPTVYWGDAPVLQDNGTHTSPQRKDIIASAYIASQGCSGGNPIAVDKIRVRFWDADNPSVTEVIELSDSYAINTAYSITIPCDNEILLNCVKSTGKIVMEVGAHNSNGWSAYSDQMEVAYQSPSQFIVTDLAPTDPFTACDGHHQFVFRNMVKPLPGTWTVALSDGTSYVPVSKVSDHFTLTDDGIMVWNTTGKEARTGANKYDYQFTFNKTIGDVTFTQATATIQFNYNVDTPQEITSLTVTGSPTTPWTEVTLTASFDAGIYSGVEWNVDKKSGYNLVVTSEFNNLSTTSVAKFKGSTVLPSTTYKVTVKGLSGTNCTSTTGLTQNVVVTQDATDCAQATTVLIAAAPVVENGPRATLNGYLKYRGNGSGKCVDDYTTYGFCYSTVLANIDVPTPASSGANAVTFKDKTGAALTGSNRNWSYTISTGLEAGQTYYYKAYVKNGSGYVFSSNYGVFSTEGKACVYPSGDVIDYYIDENYDENDKCALQFKTIAAALADLKTRTSGSTDWWDGGNSLLKANVVFHVYPGTYDTSDKSANIDLSAINLYKSTTTPTKRLTIIGETDDPTKKPVLNGLYMANSRWITVQNVKIVRETTGTGRTESSILIGYDNQDNNKTVGEMANSGLEFIKCDILVDGFTCIHAQCVDGFYMTGCNLKATRTATITDNDRNWGASIKFMNSKNIRMLRNNFRGSHANNIFFQNSRETLIMNNVFWNDNLVTYSSSTNNPSFIRLVNFKANDSAHDITKVGIYYNTFFLAQSDESGEDSKKVDFVAFSGNKQTTEDGGFKSDRYDVANIHFQYNNCYSYSTHNTGNSGAQFQGKDVTSTFTYNNFWSEKSDAATDSFEFGSNVLNHSMERGGDMICSTAPYDPDGLVIKGNALDLGSRITNDASGLGATTISDDRLRDNVRPASGAGWTYGAYQRTAGETLDVIYWLGTENTTWDNRNNWYKKVGNEYHLVTCVDNLSDNLKAVIPEQTGETKRYPKIPEWAPKGGRNEGVYTPTADMFAKTIDILYGASIMDVENLKEGNGGSEAYHYYEGLNHLEAGRKEWLMVGTVICPFNDSIKAMGDNPSAADTVSRFMISKDFYRDHQPHVYMQHFGYIGDASSGSINWSAPFTQLNESVPYDECFTVFCADQYGENKRTAKLVYGDDRGSQPIYYRFRGRFAAAQKGDGAKPSYTFEPGKQYFVNNYYPANVKAWAFNKSGTSVKYYDIISGGWNDIDENTEVKPQGGIFVNVASNAGSNINITLTESDFTTGSTKYKSAEANQYLILKAYATATGKGSNIAVRQDYKNILKAENASDDNVCELYIPHGSLKLSTISYLDADTVIALGIHNKLSTNMSVKFELVRSSLLDEIYLEDRGVEPVVRYNLLEGEMPYFAGLDSGYTEGRFYLVLGSGHTTEPDIPTPAPVVELEKSGIDIFVNENVLTVSASADMTISQITLVDMAGKSYNIPVSNANYCQRKLNAVAGVYTVKVVADKGTETKKIIVK